jgi:hypothetical protein
MPKNNSDPVGTLTVGNVVSASATLYKSNFKRYFQVSLRATAWGLAIVLTAVVLGVIGGILFGLTNSALVALPLGLVWIGVAFYCLARYSTDRAVISRLAYQELIDRPETIAEATQQLVPRTWGFFRLSWLLGLCISLVFVVGYIVLIIIGVIFVVIMTSLNLAGNPLAIGLAVLCGIGLFCLLMLVLIRYYSYWFVSELPMAVESTNSASVSMRRSRELSNAAVGRLQLIIFIAFLITLPISSIGNAPSFVGQVMASPNVSTDPTTQAVGVALMFGGVLIGAISELFIMPFWQAIKSVVYYDLRNRREGRDLVI